MTKICQTIIVAICLLITTQSYAQTTEMEYNYVTKGYKSQMEHGLDMKKGYRFEDSAIWKEYYNNRSFYRETSFKLLYRENEKTPCAILMKFKRSDTGYEEYFCIPSYYSYREIWARAKKDFLEKTKDWKPASQVYSWGMLRMISFQSTVITVNINRKDMKELDLSKMLKEDKLPEPKNDKKTGQ